MKRRLTLSALALGSLLLSSVTPSAAQTCQKVYPQAYATQALSAIRVIPGGNNFSMSAGTASAFDSALSEWNSACGSNVPTLSKTASSSVTFEVRYMQGTYNLDGNMNSCGGTTTPTAGTVLSGGVITLFEQTRNGADCTNLYEEMTTHEIGHRLGLAHSTCGNNIMAGTPQKGVKPAVADCSAVDNFWRTPTEPIPAPLPECFTEPDPNCTGSRPHCVYPNCVECIWDWHCNSGITIPGSLPLKFEGALYACQNYVCVTISPLLLYLPDYDPSAHKPQNWWQNVCDPGAPPVCLDWWGNGTVTCTLWTSPDNQAIGFVATLSEEELAGLASNPLPVEPSLHLFGNITRGPDGDFPHQNGFEALASFCGQAGASEIDLSSCGDRLVVWIDDGDAAIAAHELRQFDELHIQSLGQVRAVGKRDQCGNSDLFESHAKCFDRPGRCGTWIDIFFAPVVE